MPYLAKFVLSCAHSQHCTLARGCAHTGCKEAKLLLLHLKMCPAGNSFDCPTKHRGCEQGRKLLAHYKRCKSIRAKQLAQSNMRRDAVQQHVCLVCSLVARQARSVLDIKPPSRSNSTSSGSVASASSSATVRKMASRRVVSSFMLDSSNRVVQMPSPKMMPPPPPRAKGPSDADLVALGGQSHGSSSHHNGLPSPPGSEVKPVKFSDCGNHQYYPLVEEKKSVSFDSGSRDRSLSHSDSHKLAAPSQLFSPHEQRRPRSQSVGPALSGGAHTHAECDTILEEGEGKYPNYNMWNRSA